ncbi:pyridoxal 5'-phosphate synthase glutaminase subunit PdxT [Candidatus Peregrinibacteria bacterium]|nr:pyridoxal 5'-phosphate synthase glutaminase subunit PdxT [Candidatus Peregrinibacteria bacterium]
MTVGVLAFHGDFAEHIQILEDLNVKSKEVRSLQDLAVVHRLIIPGGESTVISQFLFASGVAEEIRRRVREENFPVYGTCAGAILLAKRVTGKNPPRALGLMDMTVNRNAYGTQRESFEATLKIPGEKTPLSVAFIRAPVIERVGPRVEVLASHKGHPVLVQEGSLLAGTFHPEVRADKRIHELFLSL